MNVQKYLAPIAERLEKISPRWWRILRLTYLRRANADTNIIAASMVFYTLICIGPLALLAAWSLQLIMGPSTDSYQWLQSAVSRFAGEAAGPVMGEVDALVTNPNAHVAGIFSALVLIWAGLRLFEALEISLTEIWPGQDERGLIARKLSALVTMLAAGALFLVSILLTAFLPSVLDWLDGRTTIPLDDIFFLQPGLIFVVELAVVFTAFFLLFKYMPVQDVPTRVAAVGALFTTIVWRAATPIFTYTVTRSGENSAIYGGLAGIVMFMTWAYFGAHILLLGAHLTAAYEHVAVLKRPEEEDDEFIRMRQEIPATRSERDEDEPSHTAARTATPRPATYEARRLPPPAMLL
jgi:membrane protein